MNLFQKIFLYILKGFALIPRSVLYVFSDFLFILNKYIIRYRKSVVLNNIREAFPEKSEKEVEEIGDRFYHQFFDMMIESVKLINYSAKKVNRMVHYKNPEVLNKLFQENRSISLVSGHTGNWEAVTTIPKHVIGDVMYIYHPLRNKFFDRLINSNRSKHGQEPVKMKEVMRKAINKHRNNQPFAIWFLADQRPGKNSTFWTHFLNHETAFYPGVAKLSKKLDMAIVYLSNTRVKRGHYEVSFELLYEHCKDKSDSEILATYAGRLEAEIRETPHNWLWSHKRWKHTRPGDIELYKGG